MPFDIVIPTQIHGIMSTITPLDVVDILIVAIILYKMYEMLQDTRGITLAKGIFVLLGLTFVANLINLHVIYWLLQKTVTLIFLALPIVFQPELRRTLQKIGQGRFLGSRRLLDDEETTTLLHELIKTVKVLSTNKIGALIVIERDMGLNDIIANGIQLDAIISSEILINVFVPNTPLHDGAAIIRGKRLSAAGCLLPLTDNRSLSTELGTRHRAALGLSEQSDALVVVVSEETGTISIAENGRIYRHLKEDSLSGRLRPAFSNTTNSILTDFMKNWRKRK